MWRQGLGGKMRLRVTGATLITNSRSHGLGFRVSVCKASASPWVFRMSVHGELTKVLLPHVQKPSRSAGQKGSWCPHSQTLP